MPQRQQHRGPHPDDRRLFTPEEVGKLAQALEEAAYLLGRGYAKPSVLDVVGRRHELEARQRLALQRTMCGEAERRARLARCLPLEAARGGVLEIDGFNLIIGLEVAISGGLLLRAPDGALRDLAGLRGSYHTVQETELALELLGEVLSTTPPLRVRVLLDRPVSNSGRLREKILARAEAWPFDVDVELVADPDRELAGKELVVSGDSLVLDTAASWVNLLDHAVRTRLPEAWVADLTRA